MKIDIKPLSVNQAWQGRRFKTNEYKLYEKNVLSVLKPFKLPDPPYKVIYSFGFSNVLSDLDNPVKLFQDIIAKKYGFNDKEIYEIVIKRVKVKKGQEFIEFDITHYEEAH